MPGTKTASWAKVYSLPCVSGDVTSQRSPVQILPFLLTPLREGRQKGGKRCTEAMRISTHAPAGGATKPMFADGTP